MVRLKNRYLLLNILYPTTTTGSTSEVNDLPPHILFNRPSPPPLTTSALTTLLRSSVTSLYGDYGTGAIAGSLAVKYWSPATSTAIVRVARGKERLVWAGLTFLTQVAGREAVVRVVRVSGTVRGSEAEVIRRARRSVLRVRREARGRGGGGVDQGLKGMGVGEGEEDDEGVEDGDMGEVEDEDMDDDEDDDEEDEGR